MIWSALRPTAPTWLICATLLAGCARAPELSAGRSLRGTGTYQAIRPLDELVPAPGTTQLEETDVAAVQARAATLQTRATALSATDADAATRARLDAALAARGG